MIPLPHSLIKNGFTYTLVLRGKRSSIYEQRVHGNIKYYEVFRNIVMEERTIFGKTFPKHEAFPHNEAFGFWAWTYRSYAQAKEKFNQLEISSDNE